MAQLFPRLVILRLLSLYRLHLTFMFSLPDLQDNNQSHNVGDLNEDLVVDRLSSLSSYLSL